MMMEESEGSGSTQQTKTDGHKRKSTEKSNSDNGGTASGKKRPSQGQWKPGTDSTSVSSSWAFTATQNYNVNKTAGNALVLIGPSEKGGAHGLVLTGFNDALKPRRRFRISKRQVLKILAELGIQDIDYVASAKKPIDYVTYMYKTAPSIPTDVEESLNTFEFRLKQRGSPFVEKLRAHRETFKRKPTLAEWKHSCLSIIGEDLTNQQIMNVYSTWQTNFGRLERAIEWVDSRKTRVTLSSAMNAIRSIGQNITGCAWNGRSFGRAEAMVFSCWGAMRGRTNNLKGVPHYIFQGAAGAGKSKLIDLIWSPQKTHIIAGDSDGVGKFVCPHETTFFCCDDANVKTFMQPEFTKTMWTMFENKFQIKTFGGTETREEMRCVITTNIDNVQQLVSLNNDSGAYKRRFCEIKFRMNEKLTFDGDTVDEELREMIVINIFHWVVNWMKKHKFYEDEDLDKRQNAEFLREMRDVYEGKIKDLIDFELHMPEYAFEDFKPYGSMTQRQIQPNVYLAIKRAFEQKHREKSQNLYWYMRNKGIENKPKMTNAIDWCELQTGLTVDANTKFCITNEGVIVVLNHVTGAVMKYVI